MNFLEKDKVMTEFSIGAPVSEIPLRSRSGLYVEIRQQADAADGLWVPVEFATVKKCREATLWFQQSHRETYKASKRDKTMFVKRIQ